MRSLHFLFFLIFLFFSDFSFGVSLHTRDQFFVHHDFQGTDNMACADCQCKRHAELEAVWHQSAALLSIRPTPELV